MPGKSKKVDLTIHENVFQKLFKTLFCCFDNNMEDKLKCCTKETPVFTLEGQTFPAKVVYVYDADSPTIAIPLFGNIYSFKTRLLGIDTLEMKVPAYVEESKREEYTKNAYKARNFLLGKVTGCTVEDFKKYTKKEIEEMCAKSNKLVEVKCHGWDKYGRFLATLVVDGENLNDLLVKNKMAYAYDGGTKDKTVTTFDE